MKGQFSKLSGHLAGADSLFVFSMALASAIYGNSARMPAGGVSEFLAMRITLANAVFAGSFMVAWAFCFRIFTRPQPCGLLRAIVGIAKGCAVMTALLALYLYGAHTQGPVLEISSVFFFSCAVFQTCRLLFRTWIVSRDPQLVIILGSGRRASKAWREIRTQYHSTVKLLGFVDDRPASEMAPDVASRYLGTIDDLEKPSIAGPAAVLADALGDDPRASVGRLVNDLAAGVLVLALAGEGDREDLAPRTLPAHVHGRVLHRQPAA